MPARPWCSLVMLVTIFPAAAGAPARKPGPEAGDAHLAPSPNVQTPFRFEANEFWLNLHHFLYVLGRARNETADSRRDAVAGAPDDERRGRAALTVSEWRDWDGAVGFYAAGPSRKDLVFDAPLSSVTLALAGAADRETLAGVAIDTGLARVLTSAAPSYRKAWWPVHRSANQAWLQAIRPLLDRYGEAVLAFITRAYGMPWPTDPYPVHLSAYSNWAGAYSTDQRLLVLSSLDTSLEGAAGLETVFHEGMHQWDDAVFALLREPARAIDRLVPRNLSHGMIFMTAGEAVRRVIPDYTPYADRFGVWARGMMPIKEALLETWMPYLEGRGTRDEALAALIRRAATQRRR